MVAQIGLLKKSKAKQTIKLCYTTYNRISIAVIVIGILAATVEKIERWATSEKQVSEKCYC